MSRSMSRRDAWIIRAAAIWTLYVWITRIWNIWQDDHDAAFKIVHTVLAVVSIGFAVAIWRVARRNVTLDRSKEPSSH
jgi:hypothetical protein